MSARAGGDRWRGSLSCALAVLLAGLLQATPAVAQPAAQSSAGRSGATYGTGGYASPRRGLPAYGAPPPSRVQPYWAPGHGWVYPRYAFAPLLALPPAGATADQPEAGDEERERTFAFDLAAGTSFPLGLGPQLTFELPARILLSVELVWMPAAYGSAVVGIIDAFGKERNILGPVVEDSLADSFVFRGSAGWRPFPSAGFELWIGYTTIAVSGSAPPDVVAGVVGGDLRDRIRAELTEDMPIDSQLHNIHFALGWRFLAADDHLVIRASVGYTQTLGSSSSIEIPENADIASEVQPVFSEDLDEILRHDVKLPVISATMGYRF